MPPSAVVQGETCLLTWQLTAEDLHPHADASGRPPLWEYSDVLGHQLLEPPHLWSIVVAVSFKNLKAVGKFKRCLNENKTGGGKKNLEPAPPKYCKTVNGNCFYASYEICL